MSGRGRRSEVLGSVNETAPAPRPPTASCPTAPRHGPPRHAAPANSVAIGLPRSNAQRSLVRIQEEKKILRGSFISAIGNKIVRECMRFRVKWWPKSPAAGSRDPGRIGEAHVASIERGREGLKGRRGPKMPWPPSSCTPGARRVRS